VSIGIADESSVVVLVIFGEYARCMQDLCADGAGGTVEGIDGRSIGGARGDRELSVGIALGRRKPEGSRLGPKRPTAEPSVL
jgi:hypothetical protein